MVVTAWSIAAFSATARGAAIRGRSRVLTMVRFCRTVM